MDDLRRLFPEPPRLSPFFAARVTANLPRNEPRPAPRWLWAYWAALVVLTLAAIGAAHPPEWALYPLVPAGFALTVMSRRRLLRWVSPFLR